MDIEQTYDHMTTEMRGNSDEETIHSDEEERENEVSDNKVDEGTICSDDEEEEIDDDLGEDGDIESVSEGVDIQSVSEHEYGEGEEYEDEESEEDCKEIEEIEIVDKVSREIIDEFFRAKGFKANFVRTINTSI
jgi:hypothetical protein